MNSQKTPTSYAGAGIILVRFDGHQPLFFCLRGRETGVWSFPKGQPEPQDMNAPLRTAVRETEEETGLRVGVDYQIIGERFRLGKRPYWIGVCGENIKERIRIRSSEHTMAGWFTQDELQQIDGNSDIRTCIKKKAGRYNRLLDAAAIFWKRSMPSTGISATRS
jgi:8-oxo-dGTP pyrophosphatase MutT (NUDIX family)